MSLEDAFRSQSELGQMTDEQLTNDYTATAKQLESIRPQEDDDELGDLANLIAERPGESMYDINADASFREANENRAPLAQRLTAIRDELKRRGIAVRSNGSFERTTPTDVDPGLDGEMPAWKQPDAPSLDPHLDTGNYDDGHSFGWKQRVSRVPGGIATLAGVAALVVALGGFALARAATPAAGVATLRPSPAITASAARSTPAPSNAPSQASGNIVCAPAPDISIALSGATSGTVTKACEPWVSLAQRNARPNTPYCRLEGIPNRQGVQAGVYDSEVMFVENGTKYQLRFEYVATVKDTATNGTLPATLDPNSNGDGILSLTSWPATIETPGSSAAAWTFTNGTFSVGADGTSGAIDADFSSRDGKAEHVKGTWTVAKGCPPVGK